MAAHPTRQAPEAVAQERLTVSLVQLIIEARAQMRGASQNGESVATWRQVVGWLEAKLPAGITVADLGDPMLSPGLNARLREEREKGS